MEKIQTIPREMLMGRFLDLDAQCARRTSSYSCIAYPAQRQVISFKYALRHIDRNGFLAFLAAFAAARRTGSAHHPSFTPASRTGLDIDKLPEHGAGDLPDFPGALACGARSIARLARLGACAAARFAGKKLADLDLFLGPLTDFLERKGKRDTQITACAPTVPSPIATLSGEHFIEDRPRSPENVAERAEYVVDIMKTGCAGSAVSTYARMSEPVVLPTFRCGSDNTS